MPARGTERASLTVVALSALALGGVGCGGGDSSKLASVDLFCAAKADKECQVAVRCAVAVDACRAARKVECMRVVASAMTSVRQYQPANAQACVDETAKVYASQTPITLAEMTALDELCARVFSGNKKELEACDGTYDCEGKLICDKGKCAARVEKKAAALCGNPGEVCEAGSYCVADMGGTYQCQKKKAKGEMCGTTAPCLEALRCQAGACQERLGPDAACTSHEDCGPAAPYCHPWVGTCRPGLSFAEGAAACAGYGGAAVDGGTGDTGVGDAGGGDAGTDLGGDAAGG